ncbi:helix-turn-helix domain-containing protein [Paenibacillus sp. OAS669]|uniref:helix-turn-helix domain-containing protein n=1 Tax=Paenibacillus sp. OAS669 TaxID=2663821 RepID=UPI00178B5F30|nr:helix-turn-helix domain-containing protein [Paenibacillus sp. OAS669]MBE1446154.1 excisionase family DNA binding protein [Paenibacillus sp. OAS669]
MIDKRHYTVNEVSEMFNVAEKTVRKWIDEGKLFAVHLGGTTVRIPEIELHQFYILSHGRRGFE